MFTLIRKLSNKGPKLTKKQEPLVAKTEERRTNDQLPQTNPTESESGIKPKTQHEDEANSYAKGDEQNVIAPPESLPGPDVEAPLPEAARYSKHPKFELIVTYFEKKMLLSSIATSNRN